VSISRHSLLEQNVPILRGLARHDNRERLAGSTVKKKPVNSTDRGAGKKLLDHGAIFALRLRIQCVTLDGIHHDQGRRVITVNYKQWQDRSEQIRDPQSVRANHWRTQTMARKMGIREDDVVAV